MERAEEALSIFLFITNFIFLVFNVGMKVHIGQRFFSTSFLGQHNDVIGFDDSISQARRSYIREHYASWNMPHQNIYEKEGRLEEYNLNNGKCDFKNNCGEIPVINACTLCDDAHYVVPQILQCYGYDGSRGKRGGDNEAGLIKNKYAFMLLLLILLC